MDTSPLVESAGGLQSKLNTPKSRSKNILEGKTRAIAKAVGDLIADYTLFENPLPDSQASLRLLESVILLSYPIRLQPNRRIVLLLSQSFNIIFFYPHFSSSYFTVLAQPPLPVYANLDNICSDFTTLGANFPPKCD